MCEELDDVYPALGIWAASNESETEKRETEYDGIRRELEEEIRTEFRLAQNV